MHRKLLNEMYFRLNYRYSTILEYTSFQLVLSISKSYLSNQKLLHELKLYIHYLFVYLLSGAMRLNPFHRQGSFVLCVRKIFRKTNILPPNTYAKVNVSGGKKCQFFRKFCVRTKLMIPYLKLIITKHPFPNFSAPVTNIMKFFFAHRPLTKTHRISTPLQITCTETC